MKQMNCWKYGGGGRGQIALGGLAGSLRHRIVSSDAVGDQHNYSTVSKGSCTFQERQNTYTVSPRAWPGRFFIIRYNANSRVSLISRLSLAFVMTRTFCMFERTRARPDGEQIR